MQRYLEHYEVRNKRGMDINYHKYVIDYISYN